MEFAESAGDGELWFEQGDTLKSLCFQMDDAAKTFPGKAASPQGSIL
jgi:hypothetical protein